VTKNSPYSDPNDDDCEERDDVANGVDDRHPGALFRTPPIGRT
jgi:hypothetical protein